MSVKKKNLRNLKRILERWEVRLRFQQSLIWLPRGLLGGLILAVLVAGIARITPFLLKQTLVIMSPLIALFGGIVAVMAVWLWRRSPLHLARRFDVAFGLKERMSTAVELALDSQNIESPELANRQYQQAIKVATKVDPAVYIPLRSDGRAWLGAAIAVVVLVVALFMPNPQDKVLAEQAAVEKAIARELEELESLREEVLDDSTLTADEQEAIIETLDEAIETLEQDDISQQEAVAALDEAQQELEDLSEEFAEQRQEALEEASTAFEGTPAESVAEALQQGDFQAAADALDDLDLDSMSEQEQQELAEALAEAAESLAESNPELAESLAEAAEALENGDTAGAEQALEDAAGQVAESGEPTTEQVDEFSDQVGESQSEVGEAGEGEGQDGEGQEQNPNGNQPGQGGMGQVQPGQAGEGQGQGQSQGQQGDGQGGGYDNSPGDGGEVPYGSVYSPQRIGGEGGEDVDVPGNPGAGAPTGVEGDFVENPFGSSDVPYWDVWSDYAGSVNEALENDYVPLGLRDLIRQYFSDLEPD